MLDRLRAAPTLSLDEVAVRLAGASRIAAPTPADAQARARDSRRFSFDTHWGDHAIDALRALQRSVTPARCTG